MHVACEIASLSIRNTSFAHFTSNDCGSLRSAAMAWNPTQIDYAPNVFINEVTFPHSERAAYFDFSSSCGRMSSCDGRDLIVIHDEDGSATDAPGVVMVENPALSRCTFEANWNAFICEGYNLVQSLFENLNSDRVSRRIGPLRASRLGDNPRNSFSRGPFDDICTCLTLREYFYLFCVSDVLLSSYKPKRVKSLFSELEEHSGLAIFTESEFSHIPSARTSREVSWSLRGFVHLMLCDRVLGFIQSPQCTVEANWNTLKSQLSKMEIHQSAKCRKPTKRQSGLSTRRYPVKYLHFSQATGSERFEAKSVPKA